MNPVLFIGNTPVSVSDNLPIVLRSPVFNDNGTPGSFIFNFKVDLSNALKQELGFINVPSSKNKVFKQSVRLISGHLNFEGVANFQYADDKSIEIALPVENGLLSTILKEFSLKELPLEENIQTFEYYSRAGVNTGKQRFQNTAFEDVGGLFTLYGVFGTQNLGSNSFYAPTTGTFTLDIELRLRIFAGTNFRLAIYKTVSTTPALIHQFDILSDDNHFGYFTHSDNKILSIDLPLAQNDIINFRILADSQYFPHYSQNQHRLQYNTRAKTSVSFTLNSALYQASLPTQGAVGYPLKNWTAFPVYNPDFFNNAPDSKFVLDDLSLSLRQELFPVVNYYDNDRFPLFITGSRNDERYYNYNTFVPFPFLAYIIEKIFEKAGITITNNPFLHNRLRALCVVSSNAINTFDRFGSNPLMPSFNLADCMPDIPAAEFLSNVCQSLGIIFQYNAHDKTIAFQTLQSIMNDDSCVEFSNGIIDKPSLEVIQYDGLRLEYEGKYDDAFREEFYKDFSDVTFLGEKDTWLNLPPVNNEPGDCWFVADSKLFYHWAYDDESDKMDWLVYSLNFHLVYEDMFAVGKILKPQFFEYSLPLTPIMDKQFPTDDPCFESGKKWLIPGVGVSGYLKSLPSPAPFYGLTFYRGHKPDSNSNDYPLATNAYRTYDGAGATYQSLSLRIDPDDANGLWHYYLGKYVNWRARTEGIYTFKKIMTASELHNFDFLKWYNILGTDYLIKEIQYNLSSDGKYLATIKAVSRLGRSDEK